MQTAYKFANHPNVPASPPTCKMFDLHARLKNGESLNREEKDYIAKLIYGIGGQKHAATARQIENALFQKEWVRLPDEKIKQQ